MLIDFRQAQLGLFIELAWKIQAQPQQYLQFDSVSDFYKASWLKKFPAGTVWYASGLDDGAEEFHAVIEYCEVQLLLSCGPCISAKIAWKH
ncbi:hypothetical protein ABLT89_02515 [Acinetobacter schindleri]|uniref:hypothetical protein n=1 Tax=Acinetobacter schindleri TaxID=108981 RepID=UPI0032B47C72